MNIGEKIRSARNQKNMTMKELANQVNLSEQAIGNYERGDRIPNIEILKKISKALNLRTSDLLDENNAIVLDQDLDIIDLKKRALDSIGNILMYAVSQNKIDTYNLLDKETEAILSASIDNIVAMTNIINSISFDDRIKTYGVFETE